jgi:hypothetical protein
MNDTVKIKLYAERPIKSGGKVCNKTEFTVEDEQVARDLVDSGAATDVDGYFKRNASASEADREDAIAKAILSLNKDTKSHWDDEGKPSLKQLAKITGSVVTVDERDVAWAKVHKATHG